MNDNPAAATRTARSSLAELVKLVGLPEAAADSVEITGGDPVFPTRYRPVVPGAVAMAAAGLAAAELWQLKTGRKQRVRIDARAAAAALRSTRYLKINGKRPEEDAEKITGFYELRDGRWMYLHCNFWNLRDRGGEVGRPGARERLVRGRRMRQLRPQRGGMARLAADAGRLAPAAPRDREDRRCAAASAARR
jgi:hypothetical protein